MTTTQFNTIRYVTNYGEHCIATKNNGTVTIQGDCNGIREMPEAEFMDAFVKDQTKVKLERSPNTDRVDLTTQTGSFEISNKTLENFEKYVIDSKRAWYDITNRHTLKGMGLDLIIQEKFNGRSVKGKICGKETELKFYNPGLFDFLRLDKGGLKGNIDGRPVNIKYSTTKNGIKLEGLPEDYSDIKMHLGLVIAEKIYDDIAADEAMAAGAIMSGMK
ncbi:hypothetical protein IJ541_10965 [bacterium]|nr:hypothetical protein [bacterium]